MYRLRALLWTAPLIVLDTLVLGTISMLCSLFDRTGNLQHRVARGWARLLLKAGGLRVEAEGLEKLDPGGTYVLAANHLSLLDIPVIVAALPVQFRFFAKEGLYRIPLLGGHLRRAGHFPVVRENPRQGLKLLAEAARLIRSRAVSVLIFPEGGRSETGELQEFKEGAAYVAIKAGVPAVPVAIAGTRECLPMSSIMVRPGAVRLAVGDPIAAAEWGPRDHEALTARLRERIAALQASAPPPRRRPASPLSRWIGYVNLVIGLLLALAAAAVYWFAWRPLPQTSGTLAAPVTAEVTVARDALGVPHIAASSLDDALFAQGYVAAQERLWQMDALRRVAAGDLAEVVGPAGLEADREARRLRLRRIAERTYAALEAPARAGMAAYARGVNHFIATHLDRLPVEFSILRYGPRPWSGVDTILIGLQMYRTLTSTWKTELAKGRMLEAGDRAKVDFLFAPPGAPGDLLPGSNAWALSGVRSATGKPLLASDPHLDYSLPGIWIMMHLRAPGLNVSGVAIPGIPGIVIGHNDRIAWGITNLGFDVQDLYVERFDPRTGRYLYRGQTEQARMEREIIRVKGGSAEELVNWITRHGPIFISDGGRAMALRWAAAEPGGIGFPFVEIDRARNWAEFTAALARFAGPGSNLVYADVDGNIGYHATGRLPIRRNFDGATPLDGASGEFEWDGYIPFDQLPAAFNPPGGIVVTANQNPFPANYPFTVSGNFASRYRAHQIAGMLHARRGWRAPEMLAVQKDVYSPFSHFLAQQIVAAWDRRQARNPQLADAIGLLRSWNGQMDKDLAAPFIIALAYQHFRKAAAESAAPGKGPVYDLNVAVTPLETLLRTRPPGWFEDYDATLLRCLQDGVEEGRRIQRREMRDWRYGRYLVTLIPHPILHQVPWVGKYFDIGPVAMSGSTTTVKQTSARMGPSMRMNADLADWDRSLMNIVAGQSGHPLSRHYKDQWEHYYTGQSYPMQFARVEDKSVLRLSPAKAQ